MPAFFTDDGERIIRQMLWGELPVPDPLPVPEPAEVPPELPARPEMSRRDWFMVAALAGLVSSMPNAFDELASADGDGSPMPGFLSQWCRLAAHIASAAMAHLDEPELSPFEYAKRFQAETRQAQGDKP